MMVMTGLDMSSPSFCFILCLEFGGPYISLAEAFLRDDLTNLINHGVTDKFAR